MSKSPLQLGLLCCLHPEPDRLLTPFSLAYMQDHSPYTLEQPTGPHLWAGCLRAVPVAAQPQTCLSNGPSHDMKSASHQTFFGGAVSFGFQEVRDIFGGKGKETKGSVVWRKATTSETWL